MKSISINSENREVKEVTLVDTLNDSYAQIGNDCSMVQTGEYINRTDAIMVDEEGYFKEGLCGFFYGENFYYGNAVVWGMNPEDGDDADCSVKVEDILSKIQWVDANTAIRIRARIMSNPYTITSF
jgi:hypothetical protein